MFHLFYNSSATPKTHIHPFSFHRQQHFANICLGIKYANRVVVSKNEGLFRPADYTPTYTRIHTHCQALTERMVLLSESAF